jgi:uncharacterized protein YegL
MKPFFIALVGMLMLVASPAVAQEEHYDNVVIVLDASGSMTEPFPGTNLTKWDAATRALKEVIAQLPQSTRVGLFIFTDGIGAGRISVPLGPKDDAAVAEALAEVTPYGVTPLGAYLKHGADALLLAREAEHGYGTYRLLVVTDGEATDQHLVERYTPDLLARGITLDVVGVAMSQDHALKRKANSYRSADDLESLVQAVEEIFAEVSLSGDVHVGEDAFEVLEELPDAFAMILLESLSSSYGNHPIGAAAGTTFEEEKEVVKSSSGSSSSSSGSGAECSVIAGMVGSGAIWVAVAATLRRRREFTSP